MSRPILALIAVLAVFVATVVPGRHTTGERHGVTQITYWTGWTGEEFDAQKLLINEFNRTHPSIHVRILSVGAPGNTNEKLRIALATGGVPDITSAVWSFELAGYAARGVLEPLDKYMAASGRSGDEFVPGVWKSLHYNDKLYGLCATTNSAFLVYNKKVMRECGLDPNRPPRTIQELDSDDARVTQYDSRGDMLRYGLRPAGLEQWSYVFGGQWYDTKTGKITANDPKNLECLQWMVSYAKKYNINKMETFEQTFGNVMSENAPFYTGKQTFWITGEWIRQHIKRYAKNLDWGFAQWPCPPGGRPQYTPVGGSIFVMPSACKHKKEAWEFLSWICGNHAVKSFCLTLGNLPPLKAVSAEPEFQNDPLLKFATGLIGGKDAIGAMPIPIWYEYEQEIGRVEDYAVHGREDPKVLLDNLTVNMQDELEKAMRGY
jgi:multiple sugar transport system substrate-binding protein